MLNKEIKFYDGPWTYFIVPWHKLPVEKRQVLGKIQAPLSVLDGFAGKPENIRNLRRFVASVDSLAKVDRIPEKEVLVRAKAILANPRSRIYLADREDLMIENSVSRVIEWIKKAIDPKYVDPWSQLSRWRNVDNLDNFDDNLAAAERYFEGYDKNFDDFQIYGEGLLKSLRDIHVWRVRPFALLGRNGSQNQF